MQECKCSLFLASKLPFDWQYTTSHFVDYENEMSKYISYSFYHIEFAIHKQAIVLYFDDNLSGSCYQGYEPLISINGLHQLHILIFFLAAFHVAYSAITMLLGRLKVRTIYICVFVCVCVSS